MKKTDISLWEVSVSLCGAALHLQQKDLHQRGVPVNAGLFIMILLFYYKLTMHPAGSLPGVPGTSEVP